MRKTIFIAALILATLACNFSTEDPEAIKSLERTKVAIELTQTAIAAPIKVPPKNTVAPPTAASPSATPIPQNGSISGTLGYPSSGIPPLEVYAISKEDPKKYYFVKTVQNQTTFLIKDVAVGEYYLVAYATVGNNTIAGGFTKAVPCGLSVSCTDHGLIAVSVKANAETRGIEIKDWYAPPDQFPPKPGK
ncbi:MAG: hypothetical protein AAB571_13370 [Chloroflexota bacterium]